MLNYKINNQVKLQFDIDMMWFGAFALHRWTLTRMHHAGGLAIKYATPRLQCVLQTATLIIGYEISILETELTFLET